MKFNIDLRDKNNNTVYSYTLYNCANIDMAFYDGKKQAAIYGWEVCGVFINNIYRDVRSI